MLKRWLRNIAYPVFECEDCIGMCDHGCYCSANDAVAPCVAPGRFVRVLRKLI
jgi:hypothetical protein